MSCPEISPDGSAVFYLVNGWLHVRYLNAIQPIKVAGPRIANAGFWSTDSSMILYPAAGLLRRRPGEAPLLEQPTWHGFAFLMEHPSV